MASLENPTMEGPSQQLALHATESLGDLGSASQLGRHQGSLGGGLDQRTFANYQPPGATMVLGPEQRRFMSSAMRRASLLLVVLPTMQP